ncbi:MAG: methionyl-tRNA formyltransferase [Candidatus Omnitrophica bacterium]|nr:methionyl-tRNA formyltransferase [Candidatus Omnitrophota bacterium]
MNIVFFGTSAFAVPILEALIDSEHRPAAVVTRPDSSQGRGQQLKASAVASVAEAHGVRVLKPEDVRSGFFLAEYQSLKPGLAVVAAFGGILSKEVLEVASVENLNVHPSLLPRHRGASPLQRTILEGDSLTGVSLALVTSRVDAGPVLLQEEDQVLPTDTAASLGERLARLGVGSLFRVLRDLDSFLGRAVEQDEAQATYAPKLSKAEGQVNWAEPAGLIERRIRAYQPWPRAYSVLDGRRLVLLRSELCAESGAPGTVLAADPKQGLVVAAGKASLRILELQPEGKRPMPAEAWLAAHSLAVGLTFS